MMKPIPHVEGVNETDSIKAVAMFAHESKSNIPRSLPGGILVRDNCNMLPGRQHDLSTTKELFSSSTGSTGAASSADSNDGQQIFSGR